MLLLFFILYLLSYVRRQQVFGTISVLEHLRTLLMVKILNLAEFRYILI